MKSWTALAMGVLAGQLAGCGSGNLDLTPTNLKVDAGAGQSAQAGQTIVLKGTAADQTQRISTMTWSVSRPAAAGDKTGLPAIVNGDCADWAAHQDGNNQEVRDCLASVVLPNNPYPETYTFQLSVVDAGGYSASATTTVAVSPYRGGGLTVDLGPDFSVLYGAQAQMRCRSYGGYVYPQVPPEFQWTQTDGSGVAVPLTIIQPSAGAAEGGSADGFESQASFTAPQLSRDASVTFQCRATDGLNQVATDSIQVHLVSVPPIQPNAGAVSFWHPGQVVTLDGSGSRDPACSPQAGGSCPLYFHWEQRDHLDDSPVTWIDRNGPTATFFAPSVTQREAIRLRVYIDRRPVDTTVPDLSIYPSADTYAVIDPYPSLAVDAGPDLTASPGEKVQLTATVDMGGAASELFYHWQQIAGSPVTVLNADHQTAGFVVPAGAAAGSSFGFRVSVARQPITGTTVFAPGEQADVHVTIK